MTGRTGCSRSTSAGHLLAQSIMVVLAALLLLLLGCVVPVAAGENLKEVSLPDEYRPEGVARGWGNSIYVGSLLGKVVKVNVKTNSIDEVLTVTDPVLSRGLKSGLIVGLKVSVKSRLMVIAGGSTGGAWVVKLGADGLVDQSALNSIQFVPLAANVPIFPGPPSSLVNDVSLREGCTRKQLRGKPALVAYLTDSFRHCIYELQCSSAGACTLAATYTHPAFSPTPSQGTTFSISLNGIVADPLPSNVLLVAQNAPGSILKVVLGAGSVTSVTPVAISEGGSPVQSLGADGLLPSGNKGLLAVENRGNRVTELEFPNDDYTTAVVVSRTTDPAFANPSTIAKVAGSLYVVNARFGDCPQQAPCRPGVKFQLVRVDQS